MLFFYLSFFCKKNIGLFILVLTIFGLIFGMHLFSGYVKNLMYQFVTNSYQISENLTCTEALNNLENPK
jgi:CHASE3 domain sensor protein